MQHELSTLPLSTDLLNYYRQRLKTEFQDAIERIADIRVAHDKFHDVTRSIIQKESELDDMKKSLSDAQLAVFDERKHLLRMISENDEFKIRELQDRKKIQYLLSISASNPEDGTTYFRKRVPKSVIVDHASPRTDTSTSEHEVESELQKTLGSIESQAAKLRITALLTQIEEQSINNDAHVKQLKNENAVRMNDLELQNDRLKSQLEGMLNENEKLRHISRENIKELLTIKRDFKGKERMLIEEKVSFYEEKNALVNKLVELEQQYRQVEKNVETKYLKSQEGLIQELKDAVHRTQEENKLLKDTAYKSGSKHDKIASVLSKRMEIMSTNYLALKKRRHFEIEGFTNDIISLRKQLKILEKSILKYAPLADKEFLLLNIARQTGLKVDTLTGNLTSMKNTLYQFENDLEANRF